MKDGEIVHEQYAGHLTPTTTHLMFSVTKSVTGLVTGLVVDRCGLDPTSLVGDILPEAADSGFGDCTVRDVLVHGTETNLMLGNRLGTKPPAGLARTTVGAPMNTAASSSPTPV
jgi:CubicO group peptidase (beta-lactamase class C family)